jgi:hypothetical protein
VDKAYATVVGKKWMDKRSRPLNKTFDPNNCPESMKAMWDTFIYAAGEKLVVAELRTSFSRKYRFEAMDLNQLDIKAVVSTSEVQHLRGVGKAYIYFLFLFICKKDA